MIKKENCVPLGTLNNVFYTDVDNFKRFEDVQIISNTGTTFGFNRCTLAALSNLCYDVISELYLCPLANCDDVISISTNITNDELEEVSNFFLAGMLPGDPNKLTSVFEAFGVDVHNCSASVLDTTKSKAAVKVKMESNHDLAATLDHYDDDLLVTDLQEAGEEGYYDEMANDPDYYEELDEEPLAELKKETKKRRKRKNAAANNSEVKVKKPRKAKDPSEPPKEKKEKVNNKDLFFYFPQTGERDLTLPLQCERCTRGFKDLFSYRQHFHRHDIGSEDFSRAFICVRCMEFETSSGNNLVEHGKKDCPVKRHDDHESKFTYFCAICQPGKRFVKSIQLNQHFVEEHEEGNRDSGTASHVCTACGRGWYTAPPLAQHIKKEGPFHLPECSLCQMKMGSWAEHKKHLDECHEGRFVYRCGLCGVSVFDSENQMRHHKMFCKIHKALGQVPVYGEDQTSCTMCGLAVEASNQKIRRHMLDYHLDKQIKCTLCDQIFFNQMGIYDHMRLHHLNERLHCDQCDKVFGAKGDLRRHQEAAHDVSAMQRFKCDECGKAFARKEAFARHKLTHLPKPTEVPTKICDICGKVVKEGSSMRKHMQKWHGTANIKCDQCPKTFNHAVFFNQHRRAEHTYVTCDECGEQMNLRRYQRHKIMKHTENHLMPFVCKTCGKGFASGRRLADHINTHTGERPYKCKFCDIMFKDSANCNKHMRESHRELYEANKKRGKPTPVV